MHVADRRIGLVLQIVAAVGDQLSRLWKQLHVELDGGDHGPRQALIFEIFALIVRAIFLGLVGGLVAVELLDVVIGVSPGRGHRDRGDTGDRERRRARLPPHPLQPHAKAKVGPARPQQMRQDDEDHRAAQPIELQRHLADPEAAGADEIAERHEARAAVDVERVRIAHVAEEDAPRRTTRTGFPSRHICWGSKPARTPQARRSTSLAPPSAG